MMLDNVPSLWQDLDRPMAAMTPWRSWLREMDDMFNSMTTSFMDSRGSYLNSAFDVEETDQHLIVRCDLPGLNANDINIEAKGNMLTISGERKSERQKGEGSLHRSERRYGRFEHAIRIPEGVKAEQIEAHYQNGVLTVAVPRPEESKPKKIKIGEHKTGIIGKLLGGSNSKKDKETVDIKKTEDVGAKTA